MLPARIHRRGSFLMSMPTEIVGYIASLLSSEELARTLSVSKRWSDIIKTTPNLWKRLYIVYYVGSRRDLPPPPLRKLLGYSDTLPLELTLVDLPPSQYRAVASLLQASMHRIRVLEVWFDAETDRDHIHVRYRRFLDALCTVPAPNLRRLSFGYLGGQPEGELIVPTGIFAGYAPNLTILVLDTGVWLDESRPTPAFSNVRALTAGPDRWDISTSSRLLPRLASLHFCGIWNPLNDYVPLTDRNAPLPADWRPVSTLCLSIPELIEWPMSQWAYEFPHLVLSTAHGVMRGGVDHIVLRTGDAVTELLEGARTLIQHPITLSITYGGLDRGLDATHSQCTGLNVLFADKSRRSVTVEWGAPKSLQPVERQALDLWRVLRRQKNLFASLTKLYLDESLLSLVHSQFGTMSMQGLTTLVIYVTPSEKRQSRELGTLNNSNQKPLLSSGKFTTLRLAAYPILAAYSSGGDCLRNRRPRVEVEEPHEVSAVSVAKFIRWRLEFPERPLRDVVLDQQVSFSDGFYGYETQDLRIVARNVRYDLA